MNPTLTNRCPCSQTAKLLRCKGCNFAFYCCKEHQTSDRSSHRSICNNIKKYQQRLDHEETTLRNHPGDMFCPPNLFENEAGNFWGIHETRDYMRARYALGEAIPKMNNQAAVEAALEHTLDLLRLCHSDNMGVRSAIPGLYLRLGKDQECYDSIKWWTTCDPDGTYDWGYTDPDSYLNLKGADAFESVDIFCEELDDLDHAVAIALIKIRMLIDVKNLQNSSVLRSKVPP